MSDQEGALYSDEGAIWASRWQIELKSKPKGSHAHIIERRNDLLRQQHNKVRTAARKDGLNVTSKQILDESLLACNCLLSVHGTSPYEALFGRVPSLLRDLHSNNAATALDDISGGATSRHIHSLRELSLKTIVQGHANERLRIAANTKTRPAVQTLNLKPGDLVEFYRDPQSKDVTGWRGPGTVVSLDRADEGVVELRWRSRLYQCRMPDVRRAIAYLVLLASFYRQEHPGESPWQIVVMIVEHLNPQTSVLFGMEIGDDRRWRLTTASQKKPRDMAALLFVAANCFYLRGVVAARVGHGTKTIAPLRGYDSSVVFWWSPNSDPCAPLSARIPSKEQITAAHLFGSGWETIRYVQFMLVPQSTAEGLRQSFPEVANLGDVSEINEDFK